MSELARINSEVTVATRNGGGLRWDEERYRTLFDLGPVAVYSCDAAGVIQEFNRRAVELWGCEPVAGRYGQALLWLVQVVPSGRHVHAARTVSHGRSGRRHAG